MKKIFVVVSSLLLIAPTFANTGSISGSNAEVEKIINEIINQVIEQGNIDSSILGTGTLSTQTEQQLAITWMNQNGLTKYTDPVSYGASRGLLREEASRFFGSAVKVIKGKSPDTTAVCEFADIANADSTLKTSIIESCQLGLFFGSQKNGQMYFNPKENLTYAQAITVLIRIIMGERLDETATPWYKNYVDLAKAKGYIAGLGIDAIMNANALRGNVGIMIYRARSGN